MHPALSVIFFTVVSGVGYGAMLLLGVALALAPGAFGARPLGFALLLAGVLAGAGLLASFAHLGKPLRAWRAFSQWRTSWLSREGVAAVVTFAPLVAAWWLLRAQPSAVTLRAAGVALTACAALTLYCTANIYRSLKTVRAWHNDFVWPGYLLHALLGGGALLWTLALWLPDAAPRTAHLLLLAVVFLASRVLGRLKQAYWAWLDGAVQPDAGAATGLARFGRVRSVEAPHTEENYLTQEMGFRVARKHAARLRSLALRLGGTLPSLAALAALMILVLAQFGALEIALAPLAFAGALAGAFVERWLFFAEARHAVMAYYQANPA